MSLEYSADAGVAYLTLDRPEVLNAFDEQLGRSLLEALSAASSDDAIRCVVVAGAGRAFSSGEDLAALMSHYDAGEAPDLGGILRRRYNPVIRLLRSMPKPVVAALNGVAAGAGASIALACDFRLASEHATIVLPFSKVGLVPDSAAVWLLVRMVGESVALELATTGRAVAADEALRLGLVTRVVSARELKDVVRTFATELARGPSLALAHTKRLIHEALDRSLDAELEAEVRAQTLAGRSDDHVEGVRAFLAKRPPRFVGR
jgi:2-(1,2-epoxy-1,2-dihydrophenyl)acetyl-CoA isomerase